MINTATKKHRDRNPACQGNLSFDCTREEQRGLVWREGAVCDKCRYLSDMSNAYEEIRTGQRGRRAATAPVAVAYVKLKSFSRVPWDLMPKELMVNHNTLRDVLYPSSWFHLAI